MPKRDYRLADGTRPRSVTQIVNDNLGRKEGLIRWIKNKSLEGVDTDEIRDRSASTGTLAHNMIEAYINKLTIKRPDLDESQIQQATNAYKGFIKWKNDYMVIPSKTEHALVSEKYKFAGTIDLEAYVQNYENSLVDFKTSNSLYRSHVIQLAGYSILYEEEYERPPDRIYLLQLYKNKPSYHCLEFSMEDLWPYKQIFLNLLSIDRLWSALDKNGKL